MLAYLGCLAAIVPPSTHAHGQTGLISRRAVLCAPLAALPLRTPAETAPDGCLTCKLKADIEAADRRLPIALGDDVGALLTMEPVGGGGKQLAVKEVVEVGSDPTRFDRTMRTVLARQDPEKVRVLVWVQSEFSNNGRPWCPDTAAALPLLESALYRANGAPIVLVSADVERRAYGSPDYFYRQHPQLRLAGVPTLYRWGADGVGRRLQEREITPATLDALLGS